MKLTCDDCGSVQSEENERCELCGASLSEESDRKERKSAAVLGASALVATGLLCITPGFLLRTFFFHEWSLPVFVLAYAAVWVAGSLAAQHYAPREDYEFQLFDNPFTYQDDVERIHVMMGLVLFPIAVVSGLWVSLFKSLTSDGP